ncbi:xanthine dehydrogenase accessory protein XdhC [Derxia gummosa]|uniref:Xanthine dehydrogenase accessory protein XdhC n=1 Tax=Derxia gummosa DSM 723 TaxID=1121388 RepID=A0A8B6XA64_9BURK|nr:xanthine dehydrogenase accessory protein XdhC [Derxia gummosa]
MRDWLDECVDLAAAGEPAVRVVVIAVRGSAPRGEGAWMVVTRDGLAGSIGGGHLEWQATGIARGMLAATATAAGAEAAAPRFTRNFVLGATLGQCCGGAVELMFERVTAADAARLADWRARRAADESLCALTPLPASGGAAPGEAVGASGADPAPTLAPLDPRWSVALDASAESATVARDAGRRVLVERLVPPRPLLCLHGAGHVGAALVGVLAPLPIRIRWIDVRDAVFAPDLPPGIECIATDDPAAEALAAPPGALHVVLTHNHEIDFDIVRALLADGRFGWLGMIASKTKIARFRGRLAARGLAPEAIARLVAPIGVPGITSKLPAAIAIAVAAQLLQVIEASGRRPQAGTPAGAAGNHAPADPDRRRTAR